MTVRILVRAIALSLLLSLAAFGAKAQSLQSTPVHYLSLASNNSTLVTGSGQNILKWVIAYNNTATIYYLKFYNKATAPTCGTDVPSITIPLPPNTTSTGVLGLSFDDTRFTLGVGFCVTALQADNDNTIAATGITINLGYVNE